MPIEHTSQPHSTVAFLAAVRCVAVFAPQRSSTGTTGKAISKTRTSDNAFVTNTKTASVLKKRIFKLLGIEEYTESWADGLQVRLRSALGLGLSQSPLRPSPASSLLHPSWVVGCSCHGSNQLPCGMVMLETGV